MYNYDTLEELVELLDQHFKNTDRFRFNYHVKDHKFYYTFTIDGNTVYEGNLTLDDMSIRSYDLPDECRDWFRDQWYDFHRNDIPQPPEMGKDITLSDHVIVTDPCYSTDTWCNGELTDVKPGVYHTKATYADIDGWGRRCTSLIVWHESIDEPTEYEHTDITVGVDSDQAGIVDFPYFKKLEKDKDRKERWYNNINTATYVRKPVSENLMSVIQKGELLIIPLNMRDGSLICVGKGNPDWNASAPHGAGRLLSRSQAKELIDLADHQAQMDGVYSSSVGLTTLDEAPDAYKPADEIKALITDTVDIKHHIKPVYNFKAH